MIMSRVLVIGAGGVGSVVVRKMAGVPDVFTDICLASRTLEKCRAIRDSVDRPIQIARVDADRPEEVAGLIRDTGADLVVNVALPYQDLAIMEACLQEGAHYLDTANYEPRDEPRFCYRWQWEYDDRFKEKGLMAVLGCGFDPGVTNIFCAYAQKELFDEIHYIDILDCNAGSHGHPFATNFNPEINIREITQQGQYWEEGKWIRTEPMSVHGSFNFPRIGSQDIYLLYHEEMESLVQNIPGLRRIRFWMTFGREYLTHLRVLQNVGMTRIDPVEFEGMEVIPLKFLKALLPDPASLAPQYEGKTCIGCMIHGVKNGAEVTRYIYNVCDHKQCYRDAGAQAVSYTTGVPAMLGAKLMLDGTWNCRGVYNVEQLDPCPFMSQLGHYGLPYTIEEKRNYEI